MFRPYIASLRLAGLALVGLIGFAGLVGLLGGCSAGGETNAVFRPYQGGVTVVDGGNKQSLTFEPAYPKLELSSRFLLRLRGQEGGTTHDLVILLDPIQEPPARYDFPKDDKFLQLTMVRDGVPLNTGNTGGFLQIAARDGADGQQEGSAVISMVVTDAGNQPRFEVDLVFGPQAAP